MSRETTPLPRGYGQFTYFFDANWRDAARADGAIEWVSDSWSSLQPVSSPGTYVNYLSSDSVDAVSAAYGVNYARLASIKATYDPTNFFRLNQNITPAG